MKGKIGINGRLFWLLIDWIEMNFLVSQQFGCLFRSLALSLLPLSCLSCPALVYVYVWFHTKKRKKNDITSLWQSICDCPDVAVFVTATTTTTTTTIKTNLGVLVFWVSWLVSWLVGCSIFDERIKKNIIHVN